MLAPLYEVLEYGEVAVVDEFSASLHPMMTRELVRLFHTPEWNAKGAQLIFATHDASLLSGSLFRRDQVWLTEKNASGSTDLYSLHDIKDVRDDDPFDKGYLRGRYGAIPFLGDFDFPPNSMDNEGDGDEAKKSTSEKQITPARSGKGAKKIDSHRS
jgi:AAA15 family ATPase/GTPase